MHESKKADTFIHMYYGFGRGKTSTAAGTLLRSYRHHPQADQYRWIQFFKQGPHSSGETLYIQDQLKITIDSVLSESSIHDYSHPDKELKARLLSEFKAFWFCRKQKIPKQGRLLIMDEVLDIFSYELCSESDFIEWLKTMQWHDIILTGHVCPDSIRKLAEYVTRFEAEKHPYDHNHTARKGIEF